MADRVEADKSLTGESRAAGKLPAPVRFSGVLPCNGMPAL